MSMLAEHKSKSSWVLNPRASDWSKDQSKLGQKMLEKMGWSVGKGLGAKEQGRVEAVRIAYKADVRGLGATRKKEQEFWLQQQESFQSFLQELNGGDDKKVKVKSLEERSKLSKTRVHYHKFTRGKDISRYSKKDLSCIIGSYAAPPEVIPSSVVPETGGRPPDETEREPICNDPAAVEDTNLTDSGKCKEPIPTTVPEPNCEMRLRSGHLRVRRKRPCNVVDEDALSVPQVKNSPPKQKKKRPKQKTSENSENVPIHEVENSPPKPKKNSSERKAAENEPVHEVENSPQKQKKKRSKRKTAENEPVSEVDNSPPKPKKKRSKRKTAENSENEPAPEEENSPTKSKKKRPKLKVAENSENEPVVGVVAREAEKIQDESPAAGKEKEGNRKNEDVKVVPVMKGKRKTRQSTREECEVQEDISLEDSREDNSTAGAGTKKRGSKKQKRGRLSYIQIQPVELIEAPQSPKKKKRSKRIDNSVAKGDDQLQNNRKVNKGKSKEKKLVKPEVVIKSGSGVSGFDSLGAPIFSKLLRTDSEEAEEFSSINSQSSLINELIDVRRHSSDQIIVPEHVLRNHILNTDSEDEDTSADEALTGISKKNKKHMA